MNLQEIIFAVQVRGLKFKPMTEFDRQVYAGAPEGALIAENDLAVFFIYGNTLTVLTDDYESVFTLNQKFEIER